MKHAFNMKLQLQQANHDEQIGRLKTQHSVKVQAMAEQHFDSLSKMQKAFSATLAAFAEDRERDKALLLLKLNQVCRQLDQATGMSASQAASSTGANAPGWNEGSSGQCMIGRCSDRCDVDSNSLMASRSKPCGSTDTWLSYGSDADSQPWARHHNQSEARHTVKAGAHEPHQNEQVVKVINKAAHAGDGAVSG